MIKEYSQRIFSAAAVFHWVVVVPIRNWHTRKSSISPSPSQLIVKPIRLAFQRLLSFLKSSKTVRGLLYDSSNVAYFSSLWMHETMIADAIRIDVYREAIRRHVKPGDTIVDLGTGTGILSLFASERRPRRIYAIDHSDVIEIARLVAKHNRVDNIEFIRTNSRDFAPPEKVDLILHEQMGHALFDENMIENIFELKRRILKPTGKILPGKFEVYLEPVCLKTTYRVPYIWEREIHGFDFKFFRGTKHLEQFKGNGYDCPIIPAEGVDHFLCDPAPHLSFDMNAWGDRPELPRSIKVSRRTVRSGQMDGMLLYFRAIFDEETSFDTSPLSPKTHWSNHLFRTESRHMPSNAELSYALEIGNPLDIQTWRIALD